MRVGTPLTSLAAVALALTLLPAPAAAIPVFAHRFGLQCSACHSTVPRLNDFGEAFRERGFRLPGTAGTPPFPVAVKVQLAYESSADAGLPKAVVDEVELLTGGAIGKRGAYFAKQYVVDGGLAGRSRDLWAGWRATPDGASTAVWLRGGQQTLPLPVDPETEREAPAHYAVFDQTAGDNPFSFFAPKIGLTASFDHEDGIGGSAGVYRGHEAGSGIAARGVDTFAELHRRSGAFTGSLYRYDGTRPIGAVNDRFYRQGYALGYERGALNVDLVYQRGRDAAANALAEPLDQSGGFAQVRLQLTPRLFALARYEGTQDAAFMRRATAGIGYRVARNMRFTAFDLIEREDGATKHTLQTGLLFAY